MNSELILNNISTIYSLLPQIVLLRQRVRCRNHKALSTEDLVGRAQLRQRRQAVLCG
jgi:hypothetical protein